MKSSFIVALVCIFLIGFAPNENPRLIHIPIKVVEGYGPFPTGFAMLSWKNMDSTNHWFKTNMKVTGIPSHWTNTVVTNIWIDGKQFAYQNFKQGKIDAQMFDELKSAWNLDENKRKFSEKPIKCYVHMIYTKDKDGKIKFKLDSNNNLDFSDEKEQTPPKMVFEKLDSLVKLAPVVTYEALRNGKVTLLKAPVLILENDGRLLRNFPQHGEVTFENNTIKICSQGFNSLDFDPASLANMFGSPSQPEIVNENEFIVINGARYKNLGVNIDQGILTLKKLPNDTLIYSSQVGFNARPFRGKDFLTEKPIALVDYKGKYLYLEFWGSWCAPCVKEIPTMKNAYAALDKSKIEFLGIAQDSPEPLKKLLDKQQIPWKQILCEQEGGIIDEYNIQGYPTSFLIDPNGKIVAKNLRGEHLLDSLNAYLNR